MVDKVIRQLIRAAIESFPINERKKSELLRDIGREIPNIKEKREEP